MHEVKPVVRFMDRPRRERDPVRVAPTMRPVPHAQRAPPPPPRVAHEPRADGVRFDVPQQRQQVRVVLNGKALEPALVQVPAAARAVVLVVTARA